MVHRQLIRIREVLALAVRRRQLHRVHGHSMQPALVEGSLVVMKAVPAREIRLGDIVLVRHPYRGVHLVKRVAAKDRDGRLWVMGDADDGSTDSRSFGAISPDRLLGRATAVLK